MSQNAHVQSGYKLRELPSCSRCNSEFILVCSSYEGIPGIRYEWECTKCHKVVPREALREEPLSDADVKLQKLCRENELERRRNKEYDRKSRVKRVSH
jgi:hypothetical protein